MSAAASSSAEVIRLEAIRVLSAKYKALVARAAKRMPTPVERNEIGRLERALEELAAMSPTGVPVSSSGIGEWA